MVTLFPFASSFPPICTTSVSIGLSMSGLLPILLAIPQHPGTPKQSFSANVYFSVISMIVAISLIGYVVTVCFFSPFLKEGKEGEDVEEKENGREKEPLIGEEEEGGKLIDEVEEFDQEGRLGSGKEETKEGWRWIQPLAPLMATIGWTSLLKYWLLGLSTYSLVCYPKSASLILWMNVTAFTSETIGRSLSFFLPSSLLTLRLLILAETALWVFLIIAVFFGEYPLLPFSGGGWIVIAVNSIYTAFYGFSSTMHFLLVGEVLPGKRVARGCQHLGLANQGGSFVGAVVSFLFVSYLDVFVEFLCH